MNHTALIGLALSLLLVGVASGACSIFPCPTPTPASGYTFPNGTAIPAEYVCPVHGWECPDDPRPLNERPGYIPPVTPSPTPTRAPHPTIPPPVINVRQLDPIDITYRPYLPTWDWKAIEWAKFGEPGGATGFLPRERKSIAPWGF